MNSIIWQGVSSTTIQGLLISELPPITKPEMRVAETIIDGRDGSMIEELGYASYEKTVTIGLYGNFDINKIIKYFTGEGDITFSNEPDKVYKAKICGRIDYTRLLRYRQASITFKVQPFKYKLNEYLRETQTETVSGTNIVLTDSANATIKNIVVGDGSVAEGQVEIKTTGKNLLPYPYVEKSKTVSDVQITVKDDGSIDLKGTANGFAMLLLNKDFKFVDGVTYTISGTTNKTSVYVCYDLPNGTRMYATSRFVWSNDYTFVQVYLQVSNGTTVDETIYPMLEIGSTASAFEPYKENVSTYDYATNTLTNKLQTFEPNTMITNSDGAPMTVEYFKLFEVFNEGLEDSKPLMILKGSGTVEIAVNGLPTFSYTFPEGENEVYIDSEKEDAYLGDVLKNRNMNGEFPVLIPKTNIIEWNGDIESISILPRSRWL